jgi:hypothetical protein
MDNIRTACKILKQNLKERGHVDDLDVDGRG